MANITLNMYIHVRKHECNYNHAVVSVSFPSRLVFIRKLHEEGKKKWKSAHDFVAGGKSAGFVRTLGSGRVNTWDYRLRVFIRLGNSSSESNLLRAVHTRLGSDAVRRVTSSISPLVWGHLDAVMRDTAWCWPRLHTSYCALLHVLCSFLST